MYSLIYSPLSCCTSTLSDTNRRLHSFHGVVLWILICRVLIAQTDNSDWCWWSRRHWNRALRSLVFCAFCLCYIATFAEVWHPASVLAHALRENGVAVWWVWLSLVVELRTRCCRSASYRLYLISSSSCLFHCPCASIHNQTARTYSALHGPALVGDRRTLFLIPYLQLVTILMHVNFTMYVVILHQMNFDFDFGSRSCARNYTARRALGLSVDVH